MTNKLISALVSAFVGVWFLAIVFIAAVATAATLWEMIKWLIQ